MEPSSSNPVFPDTRWSVVLNVRNREDQGVAQRALADLCSIYWRPIYVFARWLGNKPDEAEDLTQSFFLRVLKEGILCKADAQVGKLRSLLLSSFANHAHNVRRHSQMMKRGGDSIILSLFELADVEREIDHARAHSLSSDIMYDRQCALVMVSQALDQLQVEQEQAGRGDMFRVLKPALDPESAQEMTHEEIAASMGMSRGAVSTTLMRLRRRFREIMRQLVQDTLHEPSNQDIDDELLALRSALEA